MLEKDKMFLASGRNRVLFVYLFVCLFVCLFRREPCLLLGQDPASMPNETTGLTDLCKATEIAIFFREHEENYQSMTECVANKTVKVLRSTTSLKIVHNNMTLKGFCFFYHIIGHSIS